MSISERLQMVIKMNGMNNASFADEIGVQRSSISHVLAGRNKPSIDFIQKILTTFPKVNADWLITGKRIGKISDAEEKAVIKQESIEFDAQESPSSIINEEESRVYNDSLVDTSNSEKENVTSRHSKITKILVFYDDGTFEETVPKH